MTKKTYKTLTIVFGIISLIGLISFWGGVKPVNIGVFVFPLLLSVLSFVRYKKKK